MTPSTRSIDGHGTSERIIELYEWHARAFDRARGRELFERGWLDRFFALLAPGAHVLDLGCGGGEPIARYVISTGLRVTGVDTSATLIDLCRRRFPGEAWIVVDMRRRSLGRAFDGVLAWDSFFHLRAEDQVGMLAAFRRHAARGAALMFTTGAAEGEALGSFQGGPLYHASLDGEAYRALLREHRFVVVAHLARDPACGGHTVWLARSE